MMFLLFFAILIQSCISNNDKIHFIFDMIDISPKNAILNYQELYLYQHLTEPGLPLTIRVYKLVCGMLDANWREGLTKQQFNQSYYMYELGTDLDKDYTTMIRLYETF